MASTAPETLMPPPPEWRRDTALVPYTEALAVMEARNQGVAAGEAAELVCKQCRKKV